MTPKSSNHWKSKSSRFTCEICKVVGSCYPSQKRRFCSLLCLGKWNAERRKLTKNSDNKESYIHRRKKAGLCIKCGECYPQWPHSKCDLCRKNNRDNQRAIRKRRIANGKCGRCGKDSSRKVCTSCVRETRHNHVFRTFGVDVKTYNLMVAKQSGVCAICLGPPSHPDTNLSVDHDHQTGAVRKLLCKRCNTGLGFFLDDPAILLRASEYVQESGTR